MAEQMKRYSTLIIAGFMLVLLAIRCSQPQQPFKAIDGYMYIQKEERRNDSTEWVIVWEDEFDNAVLDTSHWTKIGLYTSQRFLDNNPTLSTDKNAWRKITDHWSSYMSSTNPEAVKFEQGNILLRGVINKDTSAWDNRPLPYRRHLDRT